MHKRLEVEQYLVKAKAGVRRGCAAGEGGVLALSVAWLPGTI